jgi:hypothetical protein
MRSSGTSVDSKGKIADCSTFSADILLKLADNMTEPLDYNVEYQAETACHRKKKRSLYVLRGVLSARSTYFETSMRLIGGC